MSQCCVTSHTGASPTCPMNGKPTKPVERNTIESLLKPEIKADLLPQPYYFCPAPDCDTVYVPACGDHLITKEMLTVRVGIKETEDPVPLCYCFDYERADVREDIRHRNDTDIEKIIRERVQAGECWCEKANPSGGCCLGEVAKAIKLAKALQSQGLL
ncbi:MAG TPA: hypothetical protein PKK23_14580 [Nitrospirales bacterium]|nr:(2Fe-2S)-binding protein [Nitrospiraceae bacterium]HNP30269.1 hypothetical protein [Nitrospirales bacterium]